MSFFVKRDIERYDTDKCFPVFIIALVEQNKRQCYDMCLINLKKDILRGLWSFYHMSKFLVKKNEFLQIHF